MGYKNCPKCNNKHGGNTFLCIQCGYKFNKDCKSFAEEYPELLKEWDYDKNNINPNNITWGYDCHIWWICHKQHSWEAYAYNRIRDISKGCPYCSNKKILVGYNDLWTTHPEICKDLLNINDGYKYSYGSNKKIYWKCNLGHKYMSSITNRILHNNGCPYCVNKKVLIGYNDLWTTHPLLCEELVDKNDGYKYTYGSSKKVKWKCKKLNHIWTAKICNRIHGRNCPRCQCSKGENKIAKILNKYNIQYKQQETFIGCEDKQKLRFDFYLPNYNICIEYQGIQHYPKKYKKTHFYRIANGRINNDCDIEAIQKRDQIKRNFCKQNNIRLIEIPYWYFNKIDSMIKDIIND